MSEIPRKPTFPSHVVSKILSRIEEQVDDNVIPVSTGIYTQQKLINQLQAIPKPILADYDDPIFYEIVEKNGVCPLVCCPLCLQDFSNKHKPVMCQFCTRWSCEECLCFRKRLHPRQKNPNGNRYNICYDCDEKYLSLQFNHTYVENRMLIETAIVEVSKEIDDLQGRIDGLTRKKDSQMEEPKRKLNIRVSFLKKEELDLKKEIKKMGWDVEAQKDKKEKLQHKLVESHSSLKRAQAIREEKDRERQSKRQNQQTVKSQNLEKLAQKQLAQEQEKKRQQLLREQREQQQRREKLEKERKLERQRQQERQEELRKKSIQKKRKIAQEQQERVKQEKRRRKIQEEQQRRVQEERRRQEQRQRQEQKRKQQEMLREERRKKEQVEKEKQKQRKRKQQQQYESKKRNDDMDEQVEQEQNYNTADNTFESSPKNNQMYNQFKNYFTQDSLQSQIELQKQQQLEMLDREERERQLQLKKDRKEVEKYEKQMQAKDMERKRVEILQEAIKRQKEWDNSKEENYPETEVMAPSEKCKCTIF